MTQPPDIRPDHLQTVKNILREHLPEDIKVWIFGSRSDWTTKDSSDLDIALEGNSVLDSQCISAVEYAFEDSDLPYTVDIVDINNVSDDFRQIIDFQKIPLQISDGRNVREERDNYVLKEPLDISPDDLKTVKKILAEHALDFEVRAFGSRASWTARQYSDLDLVLMTDEPLDVSRMASLREAFIESNLPYIVDIVDWASASESFREIIEKKCIVIQENSSGETILGEFAPFVYGKSLPKKIRQDSGNVPVFGSNGVVDYHNSALTDGPAVIIGRKGTIGKIHYSPVPCWPIDTTFYVTDSDIERLKFKYYMLKSLNLEHMNSDSAVPGLNRNEAHAYKIQLPPLPAQKAIANILGTLDDKIELNRKMSETLEEIARVLFKSWFVDFDPVRAKMEGRWRRGESLPGLPADLWELFPDKLVDSELGKIPDGWKPTPLGKRLAELVSGSRPKGGSVETGIPSIGAENVIGLGHYDFSKEKYIPAEFFENLKTKKANLQNGDVLLYKDGAKIGRKTYFDQGFPHSQCAVNEHVFILRMKRPELQMYLFFWLDQPWVTQEIISLNSNSAQPGISQTGVKSLPILLPTLDVILSFEKNISQLMHRLFSNCLESRHLSIIRDTLLPKLVNGELPIHSFITTAISR